LSNCACFCLDDNNIILLGGGHNEGFSMVVKQINLQDKQISDLKGMPGGKDLRNKIVVVGNEAYTFGGNMFIGEKYNIQKNQWNTLSSYNELLDDNLDSWSCSYTFDIPGYRES